MFCRYSIYSIFESLIYFWYISRSGKSYFQEYLPLIKSNEVIQEYVTELSIEEGRSGYEDFMFCVLLQLSELFPF